MTLHGQLNTLEFSGLIRLAQALPELEYLFRHALVQDAAYGSLVKNDRKQLHRAVGAALESLYAERLEELSGLLAHHFVEAGDHAKGISYARQAARRAEVGYAYEEAVQFLKTALNLIPDAEIQTRLEVLEELADCLHRLGRGNEAILLFEQALELWQQLSGADKRIPQRLHRKIVQVAGDMKWLADFSRFKAAAQAAQSSRVRLEAEWRQLQAEPPHLETIRLLTTLSYDASLTRVPPNWEAAEQYARAAIQVGEQLDAPVELSGALDALGLVLFQQGHLRQQAQVALRRLELIGRTGFNDKREQIDILRGAGNALMNVGEFQLAIPNLREAASLAGHIVSIQQQVIALLLLAFCWYRLDRWEDVLRIGEKVRALSQHFPQERLGPACWMFALHGSVLALRGEFQAARSLKEEAYTIMEGVSGPPEGWGRIQHY